jgi:hypothetical protein
MHIVGVQDGELFCPSAAMENSDNTVVVPTAAEPANTARREGISIDASLGGFFVSVAEAGFRTGAFINAPHIFQFLRALPRGGDLRRV